MYGEEDGEEWSWRQSIDGEDTCDICDVGVTDSRWREIHDGCFVNIKDVLYCM